MTLWALPGFLGLPSDWDFLKREDLIGINWNDIKGNSLQEWAKHLNQQIISHKILMGYSLGGRLALHALLDQPNLWKGAIIISAHPGLSQESEKEKRWEHDNLWANRFKQENWIDLMDAWNNQEIFSTGTFHFNRQEKDFQRDHLAHLLTTGSLAHQADLREPLSNLNLPILWITGSRDAKYTQLADSIPLIHPLSQKNQIPHAGHRAPWEQPVAFANLVKAFIQRIEGV
jgi:2-succinyl-6-hydroxy-2,4-cyclohexadiene-1-carboxylate synthase